MEDEFDQLNASIADLEGVLRAKFPVDHSVLLGTEARVYLRFGRYESERVLSIQYADLTQVSLVRAKASDRVAASKRIDDLIRELKILADAKRSELIDATKAYRDAALRLAEEE